MNIGLPNQALHAFVPGHALRTGTVRGPSGAVSMRPTRLLCALTLRFASRSLRLRLSTRLAVTHHRSRKTALVE